MSASGAAQDGTRDAPDAGFAVVLVAAGRGVRLGTREHKAWVLVAGRPLWWHAARAFRDVAGRQGTVLVLNADDLERAKADPDLLVSAGIERVVCGGETRAASVLAGLRAAPAARDVLVHDAARPLVRQDRIAALVAALETHEAAFLAQRVPATVHRLDAAGVALETLDRETLRLASTPQGARSAVLRAALEDAGSAAAHPTDEAGALLAAGKEPAVVDDDPLNIKVTTPADLALVRALLDPQIPRVGQGFDLHRLEPGDGLWLGGMHVPAEVRTVAHSDGDCLLHAAMEALLGAAGLADIGTWFPDDDPRWRNAPSADMLRAVLAELAVRGLRPAQVDCSILLERPRLRDWKERIKASLARLLRLPLDRVGVKARSGEGLDAVGRGEAIAVQCIVVVVAERPEATLP